MVVWLHVQLKDQTFLHLVGQGITVQLLGTVECQLCQIVGFQLDTWLLYTSGAVQSIMEEREKNGPFKGIVDFVQRVKLTACNKKNL